MHNQNMNEMLELKIEDVVYRGKGLARKDGKVIFVPGVLPGEIAGVRVVRHTRNFDEARLLAVIEPSPARVEHVCPLVLRAGSRDNTTCPGCVYQHAGYQEEVSLKQKQFVNLLERMGGVDPEVCLPPVPAPGFTGYRNKIVLHGSVKKGVPVLGYFADDNVTVIDVPACPLGCPEINELIAKTRADSGFQKSITDHLTATFRFTSHDGAMMWTGSRGSAGSWLTEAAGTANVMVPRESFFQVNLPVANLMVSHVIGQLKQASPVSVVDLYCGVGLFAIAAARAGTQKVFGVDLDQEAISAAVQNARKMKLEDIEFKATTAYKGLKWAFGKIVPEKTTVITDPPRRGLDKDVVERLVAARPGGIIYVSCAADTMARDIRQLKEAGYSVKSARLFDMFPRTPYFESVALIKRDK